MDYDGSVTGSASLECASLLASSGNFALKASAGGGFSSNFTMEKFPRNDGINTALQRIEQ